MNFASDVVNSWHSSNYIYTVTIGRAIARTIPGCEISDFLKHVILGV